MRSGTGSNYLYSKETKASFAIEHEEVSQTKEERFVAVLAQSGTGESDTLLDEQRLVELQNRIVDSRYAEGGFRNEQNYVGQTLPNFQEKIHYICPPSTLVRTLMAGLRGFRTRSEELPPPLRAAVTSFGFVYTHPFCDGNRRLHRILLHESLALDGYTDRGLILPFSSAMLRDPVTYDRVLESYSKTVNARTRYTLDRQGRLHIENAREAEGVWRYPDLTAHVEYILDLIEATVTQDLPDELLMLARIDTVTTRIKDIVDMPGPKLNLLLRLLLQNRGTLSRAKRSRLFAELTDGEISRIETSFQKTFDL